MEAGGKQACANGISSSPRASHFFDMPFNQCLYAVRLFEAITLLHPKESIDLSKRIRARSSVG